MKKACCFLVFILLLGSLVGCDDAALSVFRKNEIEKAWEKQNKGKFPGWYELGSDNTYGLVCYGKVKEYIILMYDTGLGFPMSAMSKGIDIGGYEFISPVKIHLYAYKNAKFYDLKDIYVKGEISKKGIESIFEAHKAFICSEYPWVAEKMGYTD